MILNNSSYRRNAQVRITRRTENNDDLLNSTVVTPSRSIERERIESRRSTSPADPWRGFAPGASRGPLVGSRRFRSLANSGPLFEVMVARVYLFQLPAVSRSLPPGRFPPVFSGTDVLVFGTRSLVKARVIREVCGSLEFTVSALENFALQKWRVLASCM